jgi:hypothetical protein
MLPARNNKAKTLPLRMTEFVLDGSESTASTRVFGPTSKVIKHAFRVWMAFQIMYWHVAMHIALVVCKNLGRLLSRGSVLGLSPNVVSVIEVART